METQSEVRSQDDSSTAAIEGDEVVCRRSGQRRTRLFGPMEPWSHEERVPLVVAFATIDRTSSGSDRLELVIRRGEQAVHLVHGLSREEMERFVQGLEAAKRRLATPVAPCGHCGAPGQRVGLSCGFCGAAVSAPLMRT